MVDAIITETSRKDYNEQLGHDYIQQLALAEDLAGIKVVISVKYYAVSAAAAALRHIELNYTRFALNTLRMKYQGSEGKSTVPCENCGFLIDWPLQQGSMLIDFTTVHSLELIQNLQNPKSTDCLFGLLNNTSSAMGARFLRTNILQPLTDVLTLNSRLDAVEEFTQNEQMFFQVKDALKSFLDMDRICTAVSVAIVLGGRGTTRLTNNHSSLQYQ